MTITREISTHRLSERATEYFGGDVQCFGILSEREAGEPKGRAGRYVVWQRPHWGGNYREAAVVYACSVIEAIREFDAMADADDAAHA